MTLQALRKTVGDAVLFQITPTTSGIAWLPASSISDAFARL
jgi:hypothetical protein